MIEIHTRLETYLSSIRELASTNAANISTIPVIRGELASPIDFWITRYRRLDVENSMNARSMPGGISPTDGSAPVGIVAFMHDELQDIAQWVARCTGRHARAAAERDGEIHVEGDASHSSLFVLTFKSSLSPRLLAAMSALSRHRPAGIVAAENIEEMAFAVAKTLQAHRYPHITRSLSLSEANEKYTEFPDGSIHAHPEDVSEEDCRKLFEQEFGLTVVGGHGNNIDVAMGSAVSLCGRRRRLSWEKGPLHSCEVDPARCIRQLRGIPGRLPIDDIRTNLLFIRTCVGIAPANGLYSESLLLRNAVFRGQAVAVLSYCTVSLTDSADDNLLVAKLKDGYTFGEAASDLMAIESQRSSHASSALVLFGDPDLRIAHPIRADVAPRAKLSAASEGWILSASIERHDSTFDLSSIATPGLLLPPAAELLVCDIQLQSATQVRKDLLGVSTVFEATDPPRVHVLFSHCPPSGVELTIQLAQRPFRRELATALQRSIANLEMLASAREARVGTGNADSFLSSLRSLLIRSTGIAKSVRQFVFSRTLSERVNENLVNRIRSEISRAHTEFLGAARTWDLGYVFQSYYAEEVVPDERTEPSICPYCRSNAFVAGCSAIERPDVRRYRTYCSRCTIISDVPISIPALPIIIECDDVLTIGHTARIRVELHGLGTAFGTQAVLGFEGHGLTWIDWHCSSVSDERCESQPPSQAFEMRIDPETTPGTYFLIAIVMSDLGMYFATRPVQVAPSRGESATCVRDEAHDSVKHEIVQ